MLEKDTRARQKGLRVDPHAVPPWEWEKIKKLGVNRIDWRFALTQALVEKGILRKCPVSHPATVNTTQPGIELREAWHDYPG